MLKDQRSRVMTPLARELARLSAGEMVAALGMRRAPRSLQGALALPFLAASRNLGHALAELDASLSEQGLPRAAARALGRCRVTPRVSGRGVERGPCLVLANHPGAYDALALMSALGRRDLLVLAADRGFLRALVGLSQRHLCFVSDGTAARAGALKRALSWLRAGGAVLHFPTGQIESDASFEQDRARWLGVWQAGVPALVRACARVDGLVLLAGVRGVHSARAKRTLLNRWAERRGVTTLSPLLQLWCGLDDVETRVHLRIAPAARELVRLSPEAQVASLRAELLSAIASA
jgi:hypothetical protein